MSRSKRSSARVTWSRGPFVQPGDMVKVERRYVVEGSLSSVVDEGRFRGVQAIGTIDHLVLDSDGQTRVIPIVSISEIQLVRQGPREPEATDPGFA